MIVSTLKILLSNYNRTAAICGALLQCNSFFNVKILFIVRERGGEEHRCEWETSIGCLSFTPQPVTKPATQAWALTGN